MRLEIDPGAAVPRTLYWGERRVDVIEVVDQWYGAGYRYVKVKAYDGSVYILCFDEVRDHWQLIMFSSARPAPVNVSNMT